MNVNWLGEKNILIFFIILYTALGTGWIFSIFFLQKNNEVEFDKPKINYFGYSIAGLSFAMAVVCFANWYYFSICVTCLCIFLCCTILIIILVSVTRISMILELVMKAAIKQAPNESWLLFYKDLSKAFKYIAVITAFVYILPIISMLAHVCFRKGEDTPQPPQNLPDRQVRL